MITSIIPIIASATDQPSSSSLNFNVYTPILGLAILGFTSTKLIKRNKKAEKSEK